MAKNSSLRNVIAEINFECLQNNKFLQQALWDLCGLPHYYMPKKLPNRFNLPTKICQLTICQKFDIFILSAVKLQFETHNLPNHDLPKHRSNNANVVLTMCNDQQQNSKGRAKVCNQREPRATLRPRGRRLYDAFGKSLKKMTKCQKKNFGKLSSANYVSANCESANCPSANCYPPK